MGLFVNDTFIADDDATACTPSPTPQAGWYPYNPFPDLFLLTRMEHSNIKSPPITLWAQWQFWEKPYQYVWMATCKLVSNIVGLFQLDTKIRSLIDLAIFFLVNIFLSSFGFGVLVFSKEEGVGTNLLHRWKVVYFLDRFLMVNLQKFWCMSVHWHTCSKSVISASKFPQAHQPLFTNLSWRYGCENHISPVILYIQNKSMVI